MTTQLRRARPALGTIVDIQASGGGAAEVAGSLQAAFREIERIESLLSFFREGSDIANLNHSGRSRRVPLHPETAEVLSFCLELSAQSAGLFDVTIGGALKSAGFLPASREQRVSAPRGTLEFFGREASLSGDCLVDLGGVAKGYIADAALRVLIAHGARSAIVNAGGDLALWVPEGTKISLRDPVEPTKLARGICAHQGGVATTAGYFAKRKFEGRDVIPLVGRSRDGLATAMDTSPCVSAELKSVTVQAPNCMTADALTKVLWLSEEVAAELLPRYGAKGLVLGAADGASSKKIFAQAEAA